MLNRFLASSAIALRTWAKSTSAIIDVVIGNESVDVDSVACSIVYSYILNYQLEKKSTESNPSYCIPVLQIPSSKLPLRNDIISLLGFANIDCNNILSYEDCKDILLQSKERVNIHLVDHNVLTAHFSGFDSRVSDIIDHRKDVGLYPQAKRNISFNPSESRGVGSCSTLIAQILQQHSQIPSLSECCLLLEGAVLLDTINLQFAYKTTPEDIAAVDWLENHRKESNQPSRDELYSSLSNAKYDPVFWHSLSPQDALGIDYKLFVMGSYPIGWSVVLFPIQRLEKKEGFEKEVEIFMKKEKVDALLVTSIVQGEITRREMKIYCGVNCSEKLKEKVSQIEYLMENTYHCERDLQNTHLLQTTGVFSRKALAQELVKLFD